MEVFLRNTENYYRVDIGSLYRKFDQFSPSEMIGIAQDLYPHYNLATRQYREENPDTVVGLPGRGQGFNSGQ